MKVLRLCFVIVLMAIITLGANAQEESCQADQVNIWISGTSTLHDCTVKASKIFDYPEDLSISSDSEVTIDDFSFQVSVQSMDGGRGASMNKKIYTALKSDQHPNVQFNQSTQALFSESDDGSLSALVEGVIEIAGEKREVQVEVACIKEDSSVSFSGQAPLKLSDFNIDAPSAMFGQIQTKDEIVVHFEISYTRS